MLLKGDPTLQVRLVGHASAEDDSDVNLALSKRRARAVKASLDDKKLGVRVMDFVGGKNPSGCERLEFGMWACGEASATQGEAKPEDRKVAVMFLRNAPIGPGAPNLELKVPAPAAGPRLPHREQPRPREVLLSRLYAHVLPAPLALDRHAAFDDARQCPVAAIGGGERRVAGGRRAGATDRSEEALGDQREAADDALARL